MTLVLATGTLAVALMSHEAARADPVGTTVSPRVAAQGSSIVVSGSSCTTDVHIVVRTWMFPDPPETPVDLMTTPNVAGAWSATFPMPNKPGYLIATCDGVTGTTVYVDAGYHAMGI